MSRGLERRRELAVVPPTSRDGLRGWVKLVLGVDVPAKGLLPGSASPMDYLAHTFFERPGDVVVWANRGGGKTFYGAVATLLDLLFKPGIRLCILGGSFEQAARMHEHLRGFLDTPVLRDYVDGRITRSRVRLVNGSSVALLAQAETSVRGQRVQKLRCDEVELFDEDVWRAAQFITRRGACGRWRVPGRIECFSTMHQPFGLMSELVQRADARVMRWSALDVIERCGPGRDCDGCALWSSCEGRAKAARGFLPVDDVLAQQSRSSRTAFESEMLCRRPGTHDAVYPWFSVERHVRPFDADRSLAWVGGMDFGLRNPFVMLWAQLRPTPRGVRVEVIDEYQRAGEIMPRHITALRERGWPTVRWVGVDPAGLQRNEQTGTSTVALLREAGFSVRHAGGRIDAGIERVRRLIEPADDVNAPLLRVHPRCERLIEALTKYHFNPRRSSDETPVKDGSDHAADALRYLVMNLQREPSRGRGY